MQTLQDSGYGGTDKRPVPRSEDYDGAGDKENSSPNRKVCDNDNDRPPVSPGTFCLY